MKMLIERGKRNIEGRTSTCTIEMANVAANFSKMQFASSILRYKFAVRTGKGKSRRRIFTETSSAKREKTVTIRIRNAESVITIGI